MPDLVQAVSESAHEEYILVATAYTPVSPSNVPTTAFHLPAIFLDSKSVRLHVDLRGYPMDNFRGLDSVCKEAGTHVGDAGVSFCSSAEGDVPF